MLIRRKVVQTTQPVEPVVVSERSTVREVRERNNLPAVMLLSLLAAGLIGGTLWYATRDEPDVVVTQPVVHTTDTQRAQRMNTEEQPRTVIVNPPPVIQQPPTVITPPAAPAPSVVREVPVPVPVPVPGPAGPRGPRGPEGEPGNPGPSGGTETPMTAPPGTDAPPVPDGDR
jgi:hypothetical protein